mmetsp:Transcript_11046/g.26676  ORF Transcript_11046/g.26676 Transcript_11046/m.26676 type:complete len:156 (-) Transcript_11046:91-558(-)
MKRNSSSSLQCFMSCLLEEHSVSVSDIEIQSDNAKRPTSVRSLSISSLNSDETDGSGHSRVSHCQDDAETGQTSPQQKRGRTQKARWDRWDADCEKQLVTPRRCRSPMNLSEMITFMDISASQDVPLKFPLRTSEASNSDDSVHELLDDVLAILR